MAKVSQNTSKRHIIERNNSILMWRVFIATAVLDFAFAAFILLFIVVQSPLGISQAMVLVLWLVYLVKLSLLFYTLFIILNQRFGVNYYLTDRHLIVDRGVLKEDEEIYDLYQLHSIMHHQNWLGKRYHYGDIKLVIGQMAQIKEVILHDVAHPHEYIKQFEGFLDKNN